MNLSELTENSGKQLVIIYPGRFHPFHIGHGKVYKYLKQKYSNAKVFISTSGKVDGDRSPFTFDEKKKMMMLAGVNGSAIVQTKSPYQSVEIMERFDKDTTVVVFAVSEKDMAEDPRFDFSGGIKLKKNGEPAYMQKWNGLEDAETFGTRGYIATTPTFPFEVLGQKINSASQIRNMIMNSDDTKLTQLLQDLYNITDVPQDVIELFKNKIGNKETMNENWDEDSFSEYLKENVIEDNIMKDTILKAITEGKSPHKKGTKKYKAHMAAMHAESVDEEFDRKVKEVLEKKSEEQLDEILPALGVAAAVGAVGTAAYKGGKALHKWMSNKDSKMPGDGMAKDAETALSNRKTQMNKNLGTLKNESETKERPYIVFHAKKGKYETHATSSYGAAKNAAKHWKLKSTAGIDAKLADVEHVAENSYHNEQHEMLEYIHHVLQECGDGNMDITMVEQALEYVEEIREQHFNADGSTKSESVNEAGGYYTQPVYDMIKQHGYSKVMHELLSSLDADVIQNFISRADFEESVEINEDHDIGILKAVARQMEADAHKGDYTAIDELLQNVSEEEMESFLSDHRSSNEWQESVNEHSDHEVSMARKDVSRLAKYSLELEQMLSNVSEEEGLQGWVQAKITKATDYISSVKHYMEAATIDEAQLDEDDYDDGKLRLDPTTGKYDPEEVKQMQKQGAEMARQKANKEMRGKLNRDIDVSKKAHTITVEYDLELDTPKSKNPLLKKHYQLMKKFNVFISMPHWEEGPTDSGFGQWFADVRGSKENLKGWLKAWEYDYDERDYEDMGLEEAQLDEFGPDERYTKIGNNTMIANKKTGSVSSTLKIGGDKYATVNNHLNRDGSAGKMAASGTIGGMKMKATNQVNGKTPKLSVNGVNVPVNASKKPKVNEAPMSGDYANVYYDYSESFYMIGVYKDGKKVEEYDDYIGAMEEGNPIKDKFLELVKKAGLEPEGLNLISTGGDEPDEYGVFKNGKFNWDKNINEYVQDSPEKGFSGQERNFIQELCLRMDGVSKSPEGLKWMGKSETWDEGNVLSDKGKLTTVMLWAKKNIDDLYDKMGSKFKVYSDGNDKGDSGRGQSDGNQIMQNIIKKIGTVNEDWEDVTPKGYGPDDYDEKDVAPEDHDGDLKMMQDTYKYNEDRNNHSENILMLAQAFGDRGEIRAVEGLLKIIKRQGYTTPEQSEMMYKAIHKKYYSKLFPETETEGNKFSGELEKAKIDGKKSFDVDGKTYKVKEALSKLIDSQSTNEAGIMHYSDAKGTTEYKEGQKAAKNGEPYDSNPYESGAEKLRWSKGHNEWRHANKRKKGKPNYGARGQFEGK